MNSASACDWQVAPDEARAPSLSVHLHRRSFVFPWHTFLFAEGADDAVTVAFHSHSIRIEGSGLSALLSDLAQQRIIRLTQPDRAAKFLTSPGPLVSSISVTKAQ